MEPIEFVDLDDHLVAVVFISGRGRGSSAPVETTFAQLRSMKEGKAMSLHDYATKGEAIEAAGPQEQ
jgi:hypothetical protein